MRDCLLRLVLLLILAGFTTGSYAQIRVTSPVARMVFQRNQQNEASVAIAGQAPSGTSSINVRFVPLQAGQSAPTSWTSIPLLANSSTFRGQATVPAGWYRLDVQALSGTTITATTSVNRVGVGEVFVIAGQSNVYGGFEHVPAASDDRVSCVDFRQDTLADQLLPLRFSHVSDGSNIGPSQPPHLWGMLGDRLARRLNVPILFLGAALGGTSSTNWYVSAAGGPVASTDPLDQVYRQLGTTLRHYVARTGARAVLWHQGEKDTENGTSTQNYVNNLQYVIQKSRQQLGSGQLPWVMSRVSYIRGNTSPAVIAAQNQLISTVPAVFPGPATDSIVGLDNRPDNLHFLGQGLVKFTNTWDQALNQAFFANAIPVQPTGDPVLITDGYSVPLARRPGEAVLVSSVRNDSTESDNQYIAQLIHADNNAVVAESSPSLANPIPLVIPADLPAGQYRLRTRSTHPAIIGTPSEPFLISQSVPASSLPPVIPPPLTGGTADPGIYRIGYRFEPYSHGYFIMVQADGPMEVRMQRLDGQAVDSNWYVTPPRSEAPDYAEFADFNYVRFYQPLAFGVGGIPAGRYRLSVRRPGTSGEGIWIETTLLTGRNIVYYPMESVSNVPPVLDIQAVPSSTFCQSRQFEVAVSLSGGSLNTDNVYSVKLSDATGSFANETTIGSGTASPILATFPAGQTISSGYRIRVTASSPAIVSPAIALPVCGSGADLSLALRVSNRIVAVNQPVTFTLVLSNEGPLAAEGIVLQSRLPAGLDFVDALSPGISVTNRIITINAGALDSVKSLSFAFRAKATQVGGYMLTAQVTASNQSDPDSQPNSGTGDGQDDMAQIDIRTSTAGGTLSVSPNPNQTPLPTTQSNQPTPDPAQADLSLSIASDKLTLNLQEVATLTLTVRNRGGATASNVTVQALLPNGWQIANPAGLTIDGQTVTGTIGTITAGSTGVLTIPVRIGAAGTVLTQIATASPNDPDSTPGNGYDKGEDDEALLLIRVR
ncbi:sialate O-acetylesterase [Spirosoma sp. KUDC1026]|uniref:sialate O-acetylesterase n=1 Tax=Spirosoma sp. KUDC1026 TaxID=2745947 RepID=UPI00159BD924|nr:sialate O-acetylesterase [Spirosoma sp. KUDC1026]QKZ12205.1 DUF11 domain-containing protein [Spirosoma sp. KUDC1026]